MTAPPVFGRRDIGTIKETKFTPAPRPDRQPPASKRQKPLDLGGRPPVFLLIGGNGSGKTTWARWAIDRALAAGATPALAALDRGDRLLARFFDNVAMPSQDAPELEGAAFVADFLAFVAEHRIPAVLDFGGGGDLYLKAALADDPGLIDAVVGADMAVIEVLFLAPRQQDIQLLVDMEATGIKPTATILVMNESMIERGTSFDDAFRGILTNQDFKAAVARGAYVVRVPRLFPQALALEIEDKFFRFSQAGAGVSADPEVTPIRGLDRSRVNRWLADMEAAHEAVRAALP
ncbi:MAG TPA: hypothetical protein VIM14_16930 [Polyangia bacterium]